MNHLIFNITLVFIHLIYSYKSYSQISIVDLKNINKKIYPKIESQNIFPNLFRKNLTEAKIELKKNGFHNVKFVQTRFKNLKDFEIITTDPLPGAIIKRNTPITVTYNLNNINLDLNGTYKLESILCEATDRYPTTTKKINLKKLFLSYKKLEPTIRIKKNVVSYKEYVTNSKSKKLCVIDHEWQLVSYDEKNKSIYLKNLSVKSNHNSLANSSFQKNCKTLIKTAPNSQNLVFFENTIRKTILIGDKKFCKDGAIMGLYKLVNL